MKTILATTYAVNPYKGSEDGMGWNFICQIARYNKVIAVTRENNQEAIEKYMSENPSLLYDNITFLYFDLPYWMRFWKKGSRGAMLYYWMWQWYIVGFISKQSLHFDIVHNVNFHNDWTPSYLWKLGKPLVWGPIGHHPLIPSQYLSPYSKKYLLKDRMTWLVKKYFWQVSISLSTTKTKAAHILCMNESVAPTLGLHSEQYSICPSVATEDFGKPAKSHNKKFTIISAGRLVPLKGFDLTISAFASFLQQLSPIEKTNTQLIIIGSGPESTLYKNMVKDLNIESYVSFIPWIAREELMKIYQTSSAFMFPSHEGAGMVVAEALSFGLPVICLNNCGPGEFIDPSCGIAINEGAYQETVVSLGNALHQLYLDNELRDKMSLAARHKYETSFHWDRRGEHLHSIYNQIVL